MQSKRIGISVTVIVSVNKLGKPSSKPGQGCLCFPLKVIKLFHLWNCPWCNGYCRRKWTRRLEFKSWTRMIAFHIALIPLGKV